jgi:hypothetical protein
MWGAHTNNAQFLSEKVLLLQTSLVGWFQKGKETMKNGVNAILLTDIISPLVDCDGWPLLSAEKGDKVFVVCTSPLMVKKIVGGAVFHVKENDIQTTVGRPRMID